MEKFRIMIGAGGTGGHLFPATAVIEQLEGLTSSKAFFTGTENRIESRLVPEMGFNYLPLPITAFPGFSLKSFLYPFKIINSVNKCKKLIKEFKPHAVLCTGAYVSYPAGKAAADMKAPLFLMESNVNPGKTIKMLSKKADLIFTSFRQTKSLLHGVEESKIQHTGNPVRKHLLNLPSRKNAAKKLNLNPDNKTVLIFGGSLGAGAINRAVKKNIRKFEKSGIQIIWQTGINFSTDFKLPQNVHIK